MVRIRLKSLLQTREHQETVSQSLKSDTTTLQRNPLY